uniref:Uncharacterized protein n=1 Tax=Arundo donax TaxID=35708 RepID=A0A0A9EFZ9_ARUDO
MLQLLVRNKQTTPINLLRCNLTQRFNHHKQQQALSLLDLLPHTQRHSLAGSTHSLVQVFLLVLGLVLL